MNPLKLRFVHTFYFPVRGFMALHKILKRLAICRRLGTTMCSHGPVKEVRAADTAEGTGQTGPWKSRSSNPGVLSLKLVLSHYHAFLEFAE